MLYNYMYIEYTCDDMYSVYLIPSYEKGKKCIQNV